MGDGKSVLRATLGYLQLPWHCFRLCWHQERIVQSMTKTLDFISDLIRNSKHPFRQVDNRPDKPQKHRYERRKIKEYIKLVDWIAEQQA